jgi:hypothetical protein
VAGYTKPVDELEKEKLANRGVQADPRKVAKMKQDEEDRLRELKEHEDYQKRNEVFTRGRYL